MWRVIALPVSRRVWWVDKDPKVVAKFLSYLEEKDKGFIQRLNRGMKDGWHDRTVYDAVGVEAQQHLCGWVDQISLPSTLLIRFKVEVIN